MENKLGNKLLKIRTKICESVMQQIKLKEESEKWIPKDIEKGALHKDLGIPEDEKIPTGLLKKKKAELQKKGEGDKKLSAKDLKTLQRINFALNVRK